jgi:hypothetical protein
LYVKTWFKTFNRSQARSVQNVQTVFGSEGCRLLPQVPIESQALGRSSMDIFLRLGYWERDFRVDV